MRVLHQLIMHFWQRGALTTEQADYLVEHGFIRAYQLERYEPPVVVPEPPEYADHPFPDIDRNPDPLEDKEEQLTTPPMATRKGSSRTVRLTDYSSEQLSTDLRQLLLDRAAYLPALARLSKTPLVGASIAEVVAAVRGSASESFRKSVLRELGPSPGLLAKWWECLDPEPFHLLLSQPSVCGPVARAFETLLTAASPGEWARAAWLLTVPEVQTVANLMSVRRQLVPAIRWLYEKHRSTLDRSCRRPSRPPRSWLALGFGLVLVFNARAWRAKRKPPGYVLHRQPNIGGWREAWTTAISFDAESVMPFCVHIFGGPPERSLHKSVGFAPQDYELICPNEWKV